MDTKDLIIVRGAGDIATGTICRLHRCGFKLLVLETAQPTAIRRRVSLSEAVYEGQQSVEGVRATLISSLDACQEQWQQGSIPLLIDPQMQCLAKARPKVLIDAIIAKKNYGTALNMAAITIALGPGFCAGIDVQAVIETARGHDLGRVLYQGYARANTGIPGNINGFTKERVVYASKAGTFDILRDIGSKVNKDEMIATIDTMPVPAPLTGLVRGMLRPGSHVSHGMKIADIDPRENQKNNCHTLSDKARSISGGVLEALLYLKRH